MNTRLTVRSEVTTQLGFVVKPVSIWDIVQPPKHGIVLEVSLWHRRVVIELTQK